MLEATLFPKKTACSNQHPRKHEPPRLLLDLPSLFLKSIPICEKSGDLFKDS